MHVTGSNQHVVLNTQWWSKPIGTVIAFDFMSKKKTIYPPTGQTNKSLLQLKWHCTCRAYTVELGYLEHWYLEWICQSE